ncbi:MAG: hypothetical protein R2713_21785 [Ilumatobacteraceae bacterium]
MIALLAAAAGALARRPPVGPVIGPAIMVVFGLVGGIVAAGRPGQSWVAAVPALCGALVGSAVIVVLAARIRSGDGPRARHPASRIAAANGYDRRWFVGRAAAWSEPRSWRPPPHGGCACLDRSASTGWRRTLPTNCPPSTIRR